MGTKTGVKLAYKHAFVPIFTSDGHPMLLVRPWPGKKMRRPELIYMNENIQEGGGRYPYGRTLFQVS